MSSTAETDGLHSISISAPVPAWHLNRRLYNWMLSFSHRPSSTWALFWFSFAEASFFPIPPDVLMIPMSLERRERIWFYAFIATIGSVLGGLGGYAIGVLAHHVEAVNRCIQWLFGKSGIDDAQKYLDSFGVLTVATVIFHPYKLLTIAAGWLGSSLAIFIAASIVGRAVRFAVVAALLWWFGPPVKVIIDKYFHILSIVLSVLIIAVFVALRMHGKH